MKFLIDTNIVSEAARNAPHRRVSAQLAQHLAASAVAAPTWFEITRGVARLPESTRRQHLERFLRELRHSGVPVLPYDDQAAEYHGREQAELEARGRRCALIDGQIAAIAAINNLTLVTRNVRDFRQFKDLRVENWFRK